MAEQRDGLIHPAEKRPVIVQGCHLTLHEEHIRRITDYMSLDNVRVSEGERMSNHLQFSQRSPLITLVILDDHLSLDRFPSCWPEDPLLVPVMAQFRGMLKVQFEGVRELGRLVIRQLAASAVVAFGLLVITVPRAAKC